MGGCGSTVLQRNSLGSPERPRKAQQWCPGRMQMLICHGLTHPFEKAGNTDALNFVPTHACKGSFGVPPR